MALGGLVRDIQKAVDQIAEMIRGGLMIRSTRNHECESEIYAQTVIQLDCDVVTAYSSQIIDHPDFETLTEHHMADVAMALKPLVNAVNYIGVTRRVLIGVGTVFGLVSAISTSLFENLWYLAGFVGAALFTTIGVLARKILIGFIDHRGKRLTKTAKYEAEAYAEEILSAS